MFGWVAIASALIGGGIGLASRRQEYNDAQNELLKANEQISRQKDNLKSQYDSQKDALDANIEQAKFNQNQNLKGSTYNAVGNDALQIAQIAVLQAEAQQAEGSAIQNAAVSGFRGTLNNGVLEGSLGNARKNVNSGYADSLRRAQMQRNMSLYSNYNSARDNYVNSKYAIENYNKELASLKDQYDYQIKELDIQHEQNKDDYDYLEKNKGWSILLGTGGDILAGLATGAQTQTSLQELFG